MSTPKLLFLLLAFLSCEVKPPPDITDPGQLLFLGYTRQEVNCTRCHAPDGQGGQQAPDIRKVFEKYEAEKIVRIVMEGKGLGNDAMPGFAEHLSREEVDFLVNFLRTLGQ